MFFSEDGLVLLVFLRGNFGQKLCFHLFLCSDLCTCLICLPHTWLLCLLSWKHGCEKLDDMLSMTLCCSSLSGGKMVFLPHIWFSLFLLSSSTAQVLSLYNETGFMEPQYWHIDISYKRPESLAWLPSTLPDLESVL